MDVVGLLASAYHRVITILFAELGQPVQGVQVAARRLRKQLTNATCKKLCQLEIAAAWARHATRERVDSLVATLGSELGSSSATGVEPGQQKAVHDQLTAPSVVALLLHAQWDLAL